MLSARAWDIMNMAFWIHLGIVAVAAALCPYAAWSGPPDAAENPVAADELRDGLMAALGKEFEYLSGEFGRAKANAGRTGAERFWFARVRPRAAGEFALCCAVRFNFSDNPRKPAPDRRVYLLPIKIGQRSMPRVVWPGSWGGSAYPHANVGDSLVIPIHLDPSWVGHTFTTPTGEDRRVQAFFHVANGSFEHERYMKPAAAMPLVRNQATDWLDLLAGWGESHFSRKKGGRGTWSQSERTLSVDTRLPLSQLKEKTNYYFWALRGAVQDDVMTGTYEQYERNMHSKEMTHNQETSGRFNARRVDASVRIEL
jgi:hypothetical protein